MKYIFTLFLVLFTAFICQSQTLTGIWRGTFEQNNLDPVFGKFSNSSYKYEVQVKQMPNGAIEGVTYSYLNTVFYGKASLKGIINKKNKTLTIKETVLVEVKSSGKTNPCLMTCYLDYKKNGKLETLIGTYISQDMKTKGDCGDGIVYLERVTESDFVKEDFLKLNKKNATASSARKLPSGKNFEEDRLAEQKKLDAAKNATTATKNNTNTTKQSIAKQNTNKPTIKTGTNKLQQTAQSKTKKTTKPIDNIVAKKEHIKPIDTAIAVITKPEKIVENTTKIIPEPTDEVLKTRENKLANKVLVDSRDVTIEFYDNGEVDNDSISVYKDNKLVVNNERLSTRPIVLNLKFDDQNTFYELITVAENLGDIPPNTALMVINYGRKRQEVFLTSDERKNAKVVIEYKGK